jgi:hypothetical protein
MAYIIRYKTEELERLSHDDRPAAERIRNEYQDAIGDKCELIWYPTHPTKAGNRQPPF